MAKPPDKPQHGDTSRNGFRPDRTPAGDSREPPAPASASDRADSSGRVRYPDHAAALRLERAQLKAYAEDVRKSYARELKGAQELRDTYLATVKTLAVAVEAKDDYTGGHIQRVHALGLLLAGVVVPSEVDDPQLSYGLLLHDLGKLSVPDAVLNKPGKLTDEEWELMRMHPDEGARILAAIPFLGPALDIVRHHHERWDGAGYPSRLTGEAIPLWARMFAVVDTVDAITSDRPYRKGRPLHEAAEELRKGSGTQFDPACVDAFAALESQRVGALLEEHENQSGTAPLGAVPAARAS
jgi:HD-GYP domain-containing protein (c-di-GMP phosphodiesterase class II)